MNEKDYLWVARDKSGELCLFREKPKKNNDYDVWSGTMDQFEINPSLFPNVKWEDEEPMPVLLQQAIFKS